MESAAAKARAQMSQNDFSPPARLSSWGDSGRVWRMRHKFWLPSQMYSKRKEPLCAGGKAVVRPELFVRLSRGVSGNRGGPLGGSSLRAIGDRNSRGGLSKNR